MRNITTKLLLALIVLTGVLLVGCSDNPRRSKYNAIGLVTTNTQEKGSISFHQFKGRYVLKLRCSNDGQLLSYNASLKTGNVKVYCDIDGMDRELLFELNDGDEATSFYTGTKRGAIYIIIESSDKSFDGRLEFNL